MSEIALSPHPFASPLRAPAPRAEFSRRSADRTHENVAGQNFALYSGRLEVIDYGRDFRWAQVSERLSADFGVDPGQRLSRLSSPLRVHLRRALLGVLVKGGRVETSFRFEGTEPERGCWRYRAAPARADAAQISAIIIGLARPMRPAALASEGGRHDV